MATKTAATVKGYNGKLTRDQLATVIGKRRAGGRTLKDIGEEFNISPSSVQGLLNRPTLNGQPSKLLPRSAAPKAQPAKVSARKAKLAALEADLEAKRDEVKAKSTPKAPTKAAPKAKPANTTGTIAVVKAAELHRLLSDVVPFAGTDDTMPMLTCVRVESDGKRLLAATTDRFTMGVSKLDIPEGGDVLDDVVFMLGRSDVSTLLKISKTVARDADWRLVTIRKIADTISFVFFSGETISIKPADVEFPKFKQLIPSDAPVARAATGLNPDYLAKFAKVGGSNGMLALFSFGDDSTSKPIVVRVGDNFVGMIMPIRLRDGNEVWRKPGWLS